MSSSPSSSPRVVHLARSRTYPCPPEAAFERGLAMSLPDVLGHRSGPIPGIAEVREQTAWGAPGDTRRIVLRDRSSSLETLTDVARPERFRYRITELTGPLSLLVAGIDGGFDFEPAGEGGVRVTWSWDLELTTGPAALAAPVVVPLFTRAWQGWARGCLERLEAVLVP